MCRDLVMKTFRRSFYHFPALIKRDTIQLLFAVVITYVHLLVNAFERLAQEQCTKGNMTRNHKLPFQQLTPSSNFDP